MSEVSLYSCGVSGWFTRGSFQRIRLYSAVERVSELVGEGRHEDVSEPIKTPLKHGTNPYLTSLVNPQCV